jgi:hypothetical protein
MIFKKIYTFLNDYLNGKKISKALSTLIFTLIVSSALFFSAYLADVSASGVEGLFDFIEINDEQESINYELLNQKLSEQNKASRDTVLRNMKSTPTVVYKNNNDGLASPFKDEFYILYQKDGLLPNKLYTSYLPPKNTYNKNPDTEHTLGYCGNLGSSGLKMIGRDCMIKIPFDCASSPTGITALEGQNCLNYSNVFNSAPTLGKKLDPKKCEGSKIDKKDCLSIEGKEYCHLIDNPIIGINCKLAPCNFIPNQQYRRPGVNCLADCNASQGENISQEKFFMEGFNCLSSCRTLTSSPKKIQENCVLEFNGYVMPLCNDYKGINDPIKQKHFNKSNNQDKRTNCLDVEDLPICNGYSGQSELANCVKQCSGDVVDPRHNINCINFDSNNNQLYGGSVEKACHRYTDAQTLNDNSGCSKIDCQKLSNSELANSLNHYSQSINKSSEKYCKPSVYTNFSREQFIAINSRRPPNFPEPYLTDYLLDQKPCYSRGDTEEIETILSSPYFIGSVSKITSLRERADSAYSDSDIESIDDKDFFYYNPKLVCPRDNVSQVIDCKVYSSDPLHLPPYDCNSPSFCQDCPGTTICGPDDEFCYKNGINCNNSVNKIYSVCKIEEEEEDSVSSEDEYVSWFFRPTIPEDAIKKNDDGNNYLISMKGYPNQNFFSNDGNSDIYMDKDDMNDEGYGKYASFLGFFASRTTTPPSIGTNIGIPGVGAGNICGMKGNYRGIPNDDAGYFKGEVKTTYEDNKVTHEVEICLRYASGSAPLESCGHRECKTTCAFGICSKLCGLDVCRRLKIKEGEGSEQDCQSNEYNFKKWNENDECIKTFETNLDAVSRQTRVRIYKPDKSSNYICAVIEFHGITTDMLTKPFFDGTEFFEVPDLNNPGKTKKMCVSQNAVLVNDSCQNGLNTNFDEAISNRWRTSKIIKYISAPKADYIDQYGVGPADLRSNHFDFKTNKQVNQTIGRVKFNIKRYFETSDCIRHQERIPAPIFSSIATPSNSEKLFLPSVIIESKCKIAKPGTDCEPVDETDFFKPAITILYGKKDIYSSVLSDDLNSTNTNYKIIKIEDPTKNVSGDYIIKAANIGISEIDVSQKVFIKKESLGSQPKLCLYKKINLISDPTKYKEEIIGCVNRKRATRATIIPPSSPSHTNLIFNAGFLRDEGDLHNSITQTLPTERFEFLNISQVMNKKEFLKLCLEIPGQGFPICIKRDECTLLNNECVENEKALIISKNSPELELGTIKQQEAVSNYCKKELLVKCNSRKGYKLTESNQTLNTSTAVDKGFNAPNHPDYHGWFNEFCIVSGIAKLDDPNQKIYVERVRNDDDQLGRCIKDLNCSTCDDVRCLRASCCKIVKIENSPDPSEATPHELGLCYELTNYLKSCPEISYGKNSDISDPFYIGESFLNNIDLYQANGITPKSGVTFSNGHKSHLDRYNSLYNSWNAEYEVAYAGINGLKGRCVGFYKNKISENYPTANCNSNGVWEDFKKDACEMYACPAKITSGANSLGKYSSDYDSVNAEEGSARGYIDGYANWNSLKKTKITKELATAKLENTCIVGYAKKDATKILNPILLSEVSDQALLDNINNYKLRLTSDEQSMITPPAIKDRMIYRTINSLFGKYSGFSGGVSPTRNCNQLGAWEAVTNACERITCPPIVFPEPAEAGAFYMNDYNLNIDVRNKIIYSENSPYEPISAPTKAKFIITRTLSSTNLTNPVYLSASNLYNSFLIKDEGSPATIILNKTYVVELRSSSSGKYWEIMDNSNDSVLNFLWQKSGGASFKNTGYALRSNLVNYVTNDPKDQHIVTGECNTNMKFKSLGLSPQLLCDSKGNWINLINPCISDCKAISNITIASNPIHGYATWEESSAIVGQSKVEESRKLGPPPRGGCLTGYQPYPYTPLFDHEGNKKDFGIGAVGVNNAIDSEYVTSDSYNAIAIANDGATFEARAGVGENLAPSESNKDGVYYNLKIQTSNSQSQSFASSTPQENVQTLFYLFNTEARLNIDAPSQNVWSKISFSSFGAPEYSSAEENIAENPACSSPYSKLIFANKCIGKTSCSIGLSDFTSYDSAITCTQKNLGNGTNGQQNNSIDSFGSGGGGGGGNNPGIGGAPTSSININGSSGSSFYDKSFHLNAPTLSDAENKGLKVNLKVADVGKFKGQDGSVTIIESTTQDFRSIAKTSNYTSPGEQTHTVTTGNVGQDIYIKYEMSGAGGGGGGQGLAQGTDGASGAKMTGGVFKVKRGTVLKIYVGGGGGAGKTKCRSSQGAFLDPKITQPAIEIIEPTKKTNLAMLENYQLNTHQVIAHNIKIIDRDSAIKSPLAKIFSKISDIFISEGYAEVLRHEDVSHGNWNETQGLGSNYDSGNNFYKCDHAKVLDHFIQSDGKIFTEVMGFDHSSYNAYHYDYVASLSKKDGLLIKFLKGISSIFLSNAYAQVTVYTEPNYGGSSQVFYFGDVALPTDIIPRDQISSFTISDGYELTVYYSRASNASKNRSLFYTSVNPPGLFPKISDITFANCNSLNCAKNGSIDDNIFDLSITCAAGYKNENKACVLPTCTVPLTANTKSDGNTVRLVSTPKSLTCKDGYSGSPTYTCTGTGTYTPGGTACSEITCNASGKGFANKTGLAYSVAGSLKTIACGGEGYLAYTGSVNYTCTATGTATNIGTCGCATGYAKNSNGDCVRITCTAPAGKGYLQQNTLDFTPSGQTGAIPCDQTGYSGSASYTCSVITLTGTATNIGTCGCATGYAKNSNGDCIRITCTVPATANARETTPVNYSTNTISTGLTCKEGYSGSARYTCTAVVNNGITSTSGAYDAVTNCSENTCNVIAGSGYSAKTGKKSVGSFDCDEGYYGTVSYACETNNGNATIKSASCTRIVCNLPLEAYSNITPVSKYGISEYREVDYSSTPKVYQCNSGYKKTFSSINFQEINPTYTCVGNPQKTNPSTASFQNACIKITCMDSGGIIYQFNNGEAQTFPCSNNNGFWGNSKLICNSNGAIEWKELCKPIKCLIPDGTILGQEPKNSTKDGQWVNYSASEVGMDCKPGYYYELNTRPRYKCTFLGDESLPNRGFLTFFGLPCQRITCQIPATGSQFSLNSNLDGTIVEWNGSGFISTTCKDGFYQAFDDLPPKYSCSGGNNKNGDLITSNPCANVTCDLGANFGMLAKTNLEYGANKTTNCDKLGYSGIVTYNCSNPVNAGKGVATILSSTCKEVSCVASENNPNTFSNYVTSTGTADGVGGKIGAIDFLKGGNGGIPNIPSRTSGSGGGGGSASMIAIDKRIIAIASGGGGGAGGGDTQNNSNALAKISNFENLDIKLNSNVFGPYFIGKMEYTPVNIDAQKTTGIIYDKITSPTTQLLFNAPNGTFINDVFISSYGSPALNFDSPDSLVLKYGSCNDQTSLTKSLNQCVGKSSCLINTSSMFTSCQSLASKEFGLVASYYFKEPTLQVFGSADPDAYKIKQILNNEVVPATNLINGKVYTFLFEKSEKLWFKYPYLADEYSISETITSNKIRIRFHRTNTTFSPRLKTNLGSMQIKKLDEEGKTSSLSVGYISTDKVYILTNYSGDWIIKEYTNEVVTSALPIEQREHPKRSCMTTKVSSTGAVNVSWSLPNSSCINYCPGYKVIDGVPFGDDRIGVGVTRHSTSKGQGVVYWKNGALNKPMIMKFSNQKDANGVFPEFTSVISTSHFRMGGPRQYFVLSRFCNSDGSWSDPVPLCAYHNASDTNAEGVPVNPDIGTSYINSGDSDIDTSFINSGDTVQKYLISNSSHSVQSYCRSGYLGQTNDKYWYPGVSTYQAPRYICVNTPNVDEVYFKEVPNDPQRRSCAQYCPSVSTIYASTSSIAGKPNYRVRYNGDILADQSSSNGEIELDCNQNYIPIGSKPIATCIKVDGVVRWSSEIRNNCRSASPCYVTDLNSNHGGFNLDNYWFPLIKYITPEHRSAGYILSGKVQTFPNDKAYFATQYGKCGYCTYQYDGCVYNAFNGVWSCFKRGYERKYLKSYSCNDGNWSAVWDNDDGIANYNYEELYDLTEFNRNKPQNRACDDDDWDYWDQNEEDHPNELYLGSCEDDDKTKAFNNYNNLKDWP